MIVLGNKQDLSCNVALEARDVEQHVYGVQLMETYHESDIWEISDVVGLKLCYLKM